MATCSSVLAWRIARTEEPGRLQPRGRPELATHAAQPPLMSEGGEGVSPSLRWQLWGPRRVTLARVSQLLPQPLACYQRV